MIKQIFSAIVYQEDDIYVAECPEVGTVSQGYTIKEAIDNLKEATELYLEETGQIKKHPDVRTFLTTFEVEVNA